MSYRTQAIEILRHARRPLSTAEITMIIYVGDQRLCYPSLRSNVNCALNKAWKQGEVIKTNVKHPVQSFWSLPEDDYEQFLKAESAAIDAHEAARNAQWEVLEE